MAVIELVQGEKTKQQISGLLWENFVQGALLAVSWFAFCWCIFMELDENLSEISSKRLALEVGGVQ